MLKENPLPVIKPSLVFISLVLMTVPARAQDPGQSHYKRAQFIDLQQID